MDSDNADEFENEGLFTHWVCPACGHNDSEEGDIKGTEFTCPHCGHTALMGE